MKRAGCDAPVWRTSLLVVLVAASVAQAESPRPKAAPPVAPSAVPGAVNPGAVNPGAVNPGAVNPQVVHPGASSRSSASPPAAAATERLNPVATPNSATSSPATSSPDSTSDSSATEAAPGDVTGKPVLSPITVEVPADASELFAGTPPSNVEQLKRMQGHLRRLSERLAPAVVGIRLGAAHGSGVIVSPEGHVLTAAHVAQQADLPIEVTLADGRRLKGRTLGLYRALDAALVQITDAGAWPYVEMGRSNEVKPGQWCLALGQPGGFERGRAPVVRFGRILEADAELLVSDCTLVGGDSGGPLFDAAGRVIGVHSRIGGRLTDNLHVPVNAYTGSWDRLLAGQVWGHLPGQIPFLGLKGSASAVDARITQVFTDTPAAKAGVRVGDVVLRFGGQPVTDFASLTDLVAKKDPGQEVDMDVRRGQETVTLRLVIGKR